MKNFIADIDDYINKLKNTLDGIDRNELNDFINLIEKARVEGKNIFIMGNGGSSATASHFCCDFNKGVSYKSDLPRYKFICLNDNIPTIMAYANDVSFDYIFVEQLKNLLNPNDLVIGISGSGNSKNIIEAINYANSIDAVTIGLTGYDGGKLKKNARYSVNVNVNDMQITEDVHMIFDHLVMKILTKKE